MIKKQKNKIAKKEGKKQRKKEEKRNTNQKLKNCGTQNSKHNETRIKSDH
jgi:hypothetical protein